VSWLYARLAWLHAPWTVLSDVQRDIARHDNALLELRRLLMATAEEFAARLDAATNEVANDLAGLRSDLESLRDSVDESNQAAVDAALARLDAPIARLEALGQDPADPIPAPEAPVDPAA
jgi:hypothetical protein